MQGGGANDNHKKLILCLMIVSIIFFGFGFGAGNWYAGFFCFVPNILLFIGFIIGLIQPPQPLIYMVACFVEAIFVVLSFGLAIWFIVAGAAAADTAGKTKTGFKEADDAASDVSDTAIAMFYVAGAFYILDAFICGAISFFSYKVWKNGG